MKKWDVKFYISKGKEEYPSEAVCVIPMIDICCIVVVHYPPGYDLKMGKRLTAVLIKVFRRCGLFCNPPLSLSLSLPTIPSILPIPPSFTSPLSHSLHIPPSLFLPLLTPWLLTLLYIQCM